VGKDSYVKSEKVLVPFVHFSLGIAALAIPLAHRVWAEPVIEGSRIAGGFTPGGFFSISL
jgi:hypothetical protein